MQKVAKSVRGKKKSIRNSKKNKKVDKAVKSGTAMRKFQYEFLTSTSHQLRTPLATVQSSLDLLEMYIRNENPVRQTQTLNKIRRTLADLKNTLERITTLYKHEVRKQKLNISSIAPHKFFNDLLDEIMIISENSHFININIDLTSKVFSADELVLKQIMLNLLHNAIKFSPKRSQILIQIKSGKDDIEISVKDEGIGIESKEIKNLFRPFYRAKNSTPYPGVGLGLAIVKKLSLLHKAKIKCISEPDKGTEFKILLPQKY